MTTVHVWAELACGKEADDNCDQQVGKMMTLNEEVRMCGGIEDTEAKGVLESKVLFDRQRSTLSVEVSCVNIASGENTISFQDFAAVIITYSSST